MRRLIGIREEEKRYSVSGLFRPKVSPKSDAMVGAHNYVYILSSFETFECDG